MSKQQQLKLTLKAQQEQLTGYVISNLENGMGWKKCWQDIGGANGMPYSASTGNGYQGGNIWWLMFVAQAFGYDSTQWGTFKAWKNLGGSVRKGQKSTKVLCYKPRYKSDDNGDTVFCGGYYTQYSVFNRCQVDGLADEATPEGTGIECRDGILFDYTEAEGIPVRFAGSAYYVPKRDSITLPSNFTDEARGWSTVAHEMIHSTGHGSRLNRDGIANVSNFGSHDYSYEELIAELGALFLCSELGLSTEDSKEQSAAYCQSWARKLKEKPEWIWRAAGEASRAVAYVTKVIAAKAEQAA